MRWEYIFVGAGPAALVAAELLSKNSDCRILILEAGGPFKSRGCPGLRQRKCISCSGADCRVTMGIGGASAGFGNKFCEFPASPSVLSLIPSYLHPRVNEIIAGWTGATANPGPVIPAIGSAASTRKFYDAYAVFRKQYRALMAELLSAMPKRVEIRYDAPVQNVVRSDRDFELRLGSGELLLTRNLILATGRSGHRFGRDTLLSLGVPFRENNPDIGIRVEARDEAFSNSFFYQRDPKFKFGHGELSSSRTFCSCRGGSIVPVKFGKGYFADGAFINAHTGVTNVALMARANEVVDTELIDGWCRAVNARKGTLLLGELRASNPQSAAAAVLDTVPLWPSERHGQLMNELVENVVGGRQVHMFSWTGTEITIRVYGPCVDLYWPAPALREGFLTEVEGFGVIGDAAGVSRGILQAMASGAAWALLECGCASVYDVGLVTQRDSPAAA
jgi:uncharacterized protein